MDKEQQLRDDAIARFSKRASAKYDKGQAVYNDYLVDRVSLDDMEDEIIDLWFYLQAFKERLVDKPGLSNEG